MEIRRQTADLPVGTRYWMAPAAGRHHARVAGGVAWASSLGADSPEKPTAAQTGTLGNRVSSCACLRCPFSPLPLPCDVHTRYQQNREKPCGKLIFPALTSLICNDFHELHRTTAYPSDRSSTSAYGARADKRPHTAAEGSGAAPDLRQLELELESVNLDRNRGRSSIVNCRAGIAQSGVYWIGTVNVPEN
jgi:hypothetical protein